MWACHMAWMVPTTSRHIWYVQYVGSGHLICVLQAFHMWPCGMGYVQLMARQAMFWPWATSCDLCDYTRLQVAHGIGVYFLPFLNKWGKFPIIILSFFKTNIFILWSCLGHPSKFFITIGSCAVYSLYSTALLIFLSNISFPFHGVNFILHDTCSPNYLYELVLRLSTIHDINDILSTLLYGKFVW